MSDKIVIFDIDGTLVDEEKKLPTSTKEAIFQLQKNNVHVAIATGRPPFLFEELRNELKIESYISFNGQHVVFAGETIYENPIDRQNLTSLREAAKKYDFPMLFLNDTNMVATADEHPYIRKCFEKLTSEYPKVDETFYLNTPIHQALLFCTEGQEKNLSLKHPFFHFLRWHKYSCDIIPSGGSKAVGIQKLVEAAGLHEADAYTFGDGANDIEMVQETGTGIAMGNAVEELKEVADFITSDVDEDGVVKALEHFNLL